MKKHVILQPRALADLDAQYQYIARENTVAATRWFNRFVLAIESLADLPERCSIARESAEIGKEIRQLLYGRGHGVWRALFLIEDEAIRVLCIRHAAQKDISAEELFDEP